jgi:hypothetical protein
MAGNLIDPNLSYGWTNQQPASSSNLYGGGTLGYGSVAPVVGSSAAFGTAPNVGAGGGLALAGTGPYIGVGPFGVAGNANAQSLPNPGYADSFGTYLGQLPASNSNGSAMPLAPTLVAATRTQNPSGLACQVTLTGNTGAVWVGPANQPSTNTGTTGLTQVGSAAGTYVVPSGGIIYVTTVAGVTATWITTN